MNKQAQRNIVLRAHKVVKAIGASSDPRFQLKKTWDLAKWRLIQGFRRNHKLNKSVAFTASMKETELFIQLWRFSPGATNLRSFMDHTYLIPTMVSSKIKSLSWIGCMVWRMMASTTTAMWMLTIVVM